MTEEFNCPQHDDCRVLIGVMRPGAGPEDDPRLPDHLCYATAAYNRERWIADMFSLGLERLTLPGGVTVDVSRQGQDAMPVVHGQYPASAAVYLALRETVEVPGEPPTYAAEDNPEAVRRQGMDAVRALSTGWRPDMAALLVTTLCLTPRDEHKRAGCVTHISGPWEGMTTTRVRLAREVAERHAHWWESLPLARPPDPLPRRVVPGPGRANPELRADAEAVLAGSLAWTDALEREVQRVLRNDEEEGHAPGADHVAEVRRLAAKRLRSMISAIRAEHNPTR